MPKDFGSFFSPEKKCHFQGEFSRISGSKRSFAVCTTVVPVDILRLSQSGYCILCTYLIFFSQDGLI